ncbi:NAD(P)-dependent oxidoreductase [Pseudolysinimonas yzui]|uniref:Dehydrogenase n=1 Tax=Pseudolysinimonas yzui TaxID=2708254 RepID=A0A8J3M319_9MICO|nr:NAD(P)-dependent oxidoreductase [Pseudolysinimonas yzui]GHF23611.1 dehydrogenase [Pseudolysinimonas yzui]
MRVTVPTEELRSRLAGAVEVAIWDLASPAPWPAIDIVVPPYMGSVSLLGALAGVDVRLVQSQSIGYDGVLERLPPGVAFANGASVHEGPAAEIGMALLLAAQRDLPRFVRQQDAEIWRGGFTRGLFGLRVVILGAGGLGGAMFDRLLPFGARPVRVARSRRVDERGAVAALSELPGLLSTAEAVVICLPLDDATRGLVDAGFLAAMPDGAILVNIGRGAIVDTDALVAELVAGRLRAALDVTDAEPLPARHPLWSAPGILISPHVGGQVTTMPDAVEALVRRQIAALAAGADPVNLIR